MGIIVDDDRAVRLADLGQATLHTLKAFEPGNYCIIQIPARGRPRSPRGRSEAVARARGDRICTAIVLRSPSLPRINASNFVPPGIGITLSARTSASAENP